MQASKIVAAGFAFAMAGGIALALTEGGNTEVSRPICSSNALSFPDQTACKDQMKAAGSDIEKAQVFARFQGKIDARISGNTSPAAAKTAS